MCFIMYFIMYFSVISILQILDELIRASDAMTAFDIVAILYKEVPHQLWKTAENNVLLHLRKLHSEDIG